MSIISVSISLPTSTTFLPGSSPAEGPCPLENVLSAVYDELGVHALKDLRECLCTESPVPEATRDVIRQALAKITEEAVPHSLDARGGWVAETLVMDLVQRACVPVVHGFYRRWNDALEKLNSYAEAKARLYRDLVSGDQQDGSSMFVAWRFIALAFREIRAIETGAAVHFVTPGGHSEGKLVPIVGFRFLPAL